MNRELGSDFNLESFKHFGTYDPIKGTMESYLISTQNQNVLFKEDDRTFFFRAHEPIHTEYSWKYTPQESVELSENDQSPVIEISYVENVDMALIKKTQDLTCSDKEIYEKLKRALQDAIWIQLDKI